MRRRSGRPRLCDEALLFGVPGEDEVERRLAHRLRGRARQRVREGRPGRLELVEELLRDGDVEAAEVGGEGDGFVARRCGRQGERLYTRPFAGERFAWANRMRRALRRYRFGGLKCEVTTGGCRGCGQRPSHKHRHDGPARRRLVRFQLRGDRLRLLLGAMEEPREHGLEVLGGEDPRELDHAREAQAAIANGLDDLGESLHQLGGHLAEVGRGLREPELAVEEREQAGVPQVAPPAQPIELDQSQEEVGQGPPLALRQAQGERRGVYLWDPSPQRCSTHWPAPVPVCALWTSIWSAMR